MEVSGILVLVIGGILFGFILRRAKHREFETALLTMSSDWDAKVSPPGWTASPKLSATVDGVKLFIEARDDGDNDTQTYVTASVQLPPHFAVGKEAHHRSPPAAG
ncbi:MAG: hypothetical protein GY898_28735 [Proteobacteria bacterium]|nr:hypothetical protein [Pseudomonadota bacterium]